MDTIPKLALPDEDDKLLARELMTDTLALIESEDTNYEVRYRLVMLVMSFAAVAGLRTGYRIDPEEPDWPVAYIELPTGQVSWHMPAFPIEYDGHTTTEKYARIREYVNAE